MTFYVNEREALGKVIVFPFFVTALGLILYGASVYIIVFVSSVRDFPLNTVVAQSNIMYSTIFGIISAVLGVVIQYFVNKKMTELHKQEIIEVM